MPKVVTIKDLKRHYGEIECPLYGKSLQVFGSCFKIQSELFESKCPYSSLSNVEPSKGLPVVGCNYV